jgi:CelD/BcsL family acetyltransferase involved in cellulose biosynthesis
MDTGTDSVQLIKSVPAFLALEREWRELCNRVPNHYFTQSFDWCRVSWKKVAKPRGRQLCCVVVRQDRRTVLIWPLVTYRRKFWSFSRPLGPETTEYTAPLVEDGPHSEQWVAEAWRVVREPHTSDVIFLPYVRADSLLHKIVSREKAATPPGIDKISYVTWDAFLDWDSYYRTLDSNERQSVRRRRRRFSDIGKVTFCPTIDPDECPEVIDWILAQKTDWLVRTGRQNPWLEDDQYKRFLIAMSSRTNGVEGIVISVLKLDNKLVAALLLRRDKVRLEGVISVFDPAYRQFGPGKILQEAVMRWACEQRLTYDFRIGTEAYKHYMSNGECEAISYAFANSVWGKVYFRLMPIWDRIPARLREVIRIGANR